MKIFFILMLVASVYCAVNWVAGFSSLTVYTVSGAGGLWQNFIDRCQEFEDNGGAVRGLNCVGNGVFYLMGAAAAFGAGQAGAMYILNQGVTTQGKRDSLGNSTAANRSWDWPAIHSSPDDLHSLLASGLPGPVAGYVYNHSDSSLDNSVTVFVESGSGTFAHSSNVTHGIVAFLPSSTDESANSTTIRRSNYRWDFQGLAGMKFSYSNPGCQGYSFGWADETSQLRNEVWNFVNWANYGNQGSTYDLEWSDNNRYGTPYVAGRLILEIYGFALSFEGAPGLNDCVR